MNEKLPELGKCGYDWEKYFNFLNKKKDEKTGEEYLDYAAFRTGAIDREYLLSTKNLNIVFKILNKSGSGILSSEELQNAVGGNHVHDKSGGAGIMSSAKPLNDSGIKHEDLKGT